MDLNRFHLQSLKTRITFLTLFVFLSGLWLLAAFSNHILHRDMERVLSDKQFSIATLLANEIDREFDNRVNWLKKVASPFSEPLKQRPAELQALIEQRPILHELFNNGVFVTGLDGQLVANIALYQNRLTPCDLLDPVECFWVTVAEVVENNNFVAGLKQLDAGVGSDVTGTAGNQNTHARPPTWASNSMATALRVFASEPEYLPAKHAKSLPVATFLS